MSRVVIGIAAGITVLTVIISLLVYMNVSTTGSRSEDGKTLNLSITIGGRPIENGSVVTAIDENNDGKPIQLIAVCEGENTKLVSCTWIPLEEAKRTPEEKALAERAK